MCIRRKEKMQIIRDKEKKQKREQVSVDCWTDLITYLKSVSFAPLSKSNFY